MAGGTTGGNKDNKEQSSANKNYVGMMHIKMIKLIVMKQHTIQMLKVQLQQFTFKGTAVDVYSRTNGDVGLIRAVLYKGTEVTKSAYQMKYIDNVSQSGDYYQIPTLSFDDLEYGTYTVQITLGKRPRYNRNILLRWYSCNIIH